VTDSLAALARAESCGAAWGTDPSPRPSPRRGEGARRLPSPAEGQRWRRASPPNEGGGVGDGRTTLSFLILAALALATWQFGEALYLHAKAELGQYLLHRAWTEARTHGVPVKPWPWADTHPVARLTVPGRGVDLLVLSGANGRTLAWGPGHAEASAAPGAIGNAVITAHRDTHFAFLRDVAAGDAIVVENAAGVTRRYRVQRMLVADHRALLLPDDGERATLSLVTCYPFDGIDPRTPLRYAVIASAE
jgi:sortase A